MQGKVLEIGRGRLFPAEKQTQSCFQAVPIRFDYYKDANTDVVGDATSSEILWPRV